MALGVLQTNFLNDLLSNWLTGSNENTLFVHGFPGTGKSHFGRKFDDAVKQKNYLPVFFTVSNGSFSIDDFYLELMQKLADEGIEDLAVAFDQKRNLNHALLKLLKTHAVCIVIDEFQLVQDREGVPAEGFRKLVEVVSSEATQGKLLLLTNQKIATDKWSEQSRVESLPLLSNEEAISLFDEQLQQAGIVLTLQPEAKSRLVNLVLKNNPRAQQVLVGLLSFSEMDEVIKEIPELDATGIEMTTQVLYELERRIVNQSLRRLEEKEQRMLENLSVIRKPFKKEAIERVEQNADESLRLRQHLSSIFFLEKQAGDWFSLHPIVKEVCRAKLEDDKGRFVSSHNQAATYYTRHFKQKELKGSRLGEYYTEATFHLTKAGNEVELRKVTSQFADLIHATIHATSPVPDIAELLNYRIEILKAYLDTGGPPEIENYLARCYKKRNNSGDLEQALKHAIHGERSKNFPQNRLLRIELDEQVNGGESAIKLAQNLIEETVSKYDGHEIYAICAELMARNNQLDEAIKLLKDCIDQKRVPVDKSLFSLYNMYADLMGRNNYSNIQIAALYEKALKEIPNASGGTELLFRVLYKFFRTRDPVFGDLVDNFATIPVQKIQLKVFQYYIKEDYEAGMKLTLDSFNLNTNISMLTSLAWVNMILGKYAEAVKLLQNSPLTLKTSASYSWLLGLSALLAGDIQLAAAQYQKLNNMAFTAGITLKHFIRYWWVTRNEAGSTPANFYPHIPPSVTGFSKTLWINSPTIEADIKLCLEGSESPVVTPVDNSRNVLCIATEWFSRKGGISTFNRRLCCELATQQYNVVCYLPAIKDEELEDARAAGVALIKARALAEPDELRRLDQKPVFLDAFEPSVIVGHDRFTGPAMKRLREAFFPLARTIFFIHTAPGQIEPEKNEIAAQRSEDRERVQKELASASDIVAAVGPLLFHETEHLIASLDLRPKLVQFDPGLNREPDIIDYSIKSTIPEVYLLGRVEDYELKGVDLAVKAVAKVYTGWNPKLLVKPRLRIRGVEPIQEREFKIKTDNEKGISGVPVNIRLYNSDSEEISKEMAASALVLMPSKVEGFGLVALEAISLGRPVLISEKSGLAQLIDKHVPEESVHWILPVDGQEDIAKLWAQKINEILIDRPGAGERLKRLVEKLDAVVSWKKSVGILMQSIENDLPLETNQETVVGSEQ